MEGIKNHLNTRLILLIIIVLSILSSMAVFLIPQDQYPAIYIKNALGLPFIVLFPGYALTKVVFPKKILSTQEDKLINTLARLALSFCSSIAIIALLGLGLNYTSVGITIVPMTTCLLIFTIAFSIIGFIKGE
jgi:uncharacterized membrane protein